MRARVLKSAGPNSPPALREQGGAAFPAPNVQKCSPEWLQRGPRGAGQTSRDRVRCKGQRCGRPIWTDHFYCRDCWDELLGRLCQEIDRIARDAAEIYIGRTCDPDARREEHYEDFGRGNLVVLHWSDDILEVAA